MWPCLIGISAAILDRITLTALAAGDCDCRFGSQIDELKPGE
jgi:hypothetical protein